MTKFMEKIFGKKTEPEIAERRGEEPREEYKEEEKKPHQYRGRFIATIVVVFLLSAGAIAFLALHSRSNTQTEAQNRKKDNSAGQKVETSAVKESETERTLLLVGEARPYYSVTLYARVSGYMDQLKADIGDVVKKDQLLAHVESPEQEQAYLSAKANAFNLRQIANRMKILFKKKLVSQQQEEQAVSQADVAEANQETQAVLRSYQNITAPFDGVISNRFVDPGWLLQNASATQSASQPLFTISKIDQLRLFVYVDQKDAPYVRVGDSIEVDVPNTTNSHQTGKVEMIAGELDPKTRTLLVETILPNPTQAIVAGSFVQVKMKLKTPAFLELPVQALVMRKADAFVPVVQQDGTLAYKKIDLAENDGERILIRSGVSVGEKAAINIGSTLSEGQKVQTANTQVAGTADMKGGAENKSQPQMQNQLQQPQPKADEARKAEPSNTPSPVKSGEKSNFDEGKKDSKG
jgi:membrane fusion protein (multidrug efflux system)